MYVCMYLSLKKLKIIKRHGGSFLTYALIEAFIYIYIYKRIKID